MTTMALKTKSRYSAKPIPSEQWLAVGFMHIVDYCRFTYKDFRLSEHDKVRTKHTFDRLVSEGKLFRGIYKRRQWIGYALVLRMTQRFVD